MRMESMCWGVQGGDSDVTACVLHKVAPCTCRDTSPVRTAKIMRPGRISASMPCAARPARGPCSCRGLYQRGVAPPQPRWHGRHDKRTRSSAAARQAILWYILDARGNGSAQGGVRMSWLSVVSLLMAGGAPLAHAEALTCMRQTERNCV